MKNKILLLLLVSFSFMGNMVHAQTCPTVLFAFSSQVSCSGGDVDITLFICQNSVPATSSVVLDHIEWDFGDGSPILSTSSLSVTHNYTTSNIFHASAELFFIVDGVPCSTKAKEIQPASVPNPTGAYMSPFAESMDVFCDYNGVSTQEYLDIHVLLFNADLIITYDPQTSPTIDFKAELSGTAPGVPANYTFNIDNALVQAGSFSGTGLFNITSISATTLTPGQHTAELIITDRNTTTCPIIKTVTFEVYPVEPPCAYCLTFKPEPNKRYWVSGWVKVLDASASPTSLPQVITYDNGLSTNTAGIELAFSGPSPLTVYFKPSGDIIEGWQRIAGEFTVPNGATEVNIKLNHPNPGSGPTKVAYFDDIRIHPFNASMKSYVNDPDTFWLTAELDDNNYATFYEYDMEGKLIRIKKETSRGIVTIKENRSSNPKTN